LKKSNKTVFTNLLLFFISLCYTLHSFRLLYIGVVAGSVDVANQNVMLEITALSLEHQLFTYCCSTSNINRNSSSSSSSGGGGIIEKYKVEAMHVLNVLKDDKNVNVVSDLLKGSRSLRDVLKPGSAFRGT